MKFLLSLFFVCNFLFAANSSQVITPSAPLDLSFGVLSIPQADTDTDGYLSSADWNTFNGAVGSGVTSLNSLTGALSLISGSGGTDFNIDSTGTTITLNFPTSSGTNRGLLSSTDWTTFNSSLRLDGSNSPTANIPWGSNKITGLADPDDAQDAATKAYVDAHLTPPSGSDTEVQFNDSNAFGADSNFTYTKATDVLNVVGGLGVGFLGAPDTKAHIQGDQPTSPVFLTVENIGTSGATNSAYAGLIFNRDSNPSVNANIGNISSRVAGTAYSTIAMVKDDGGTTEGAIRFYTKEDAGSNTLKWEISGDGHLVPASNGGYNLGASTFALNTVYTRDIRIENSSGSDILWLTDGAGDIGTASSGRPNNIYSTSSVNVGNGGVIASSTSVSISAATASTPTQFNSSKELVSVPNQFVQSGSATTTDAITTTIATLPLSDDTTYMCEALVSGRRTDSAGRALVKVYGSAYREAAGNCTKAGTDTTGFSVLSTSTYQVSLSCSGTDLLLRVRGASSETLNWTGTMTCQASS
jgi:hypothetical protein